MLLGNKHYKDVLVMFPAKLKIAESMGWLIGILLL